MWNKVLVTGGSGLVGKHLQAIIPDAIYVSSKDYDLTQPDNIANMLYRYKPHTVVHLAARVGGILDNLKYPVEYLEENLIMNTHLLHYCHKFDVKNVVAMLSTCIYPDVVETYPLKEADLHKGPPTASNFSYGIAKRCMSAQVDTYNKQYNKGWTCLIPCNLYGEYDKYTEHNSHFVSALIKKIHDATDEITLWGTGKPLRQFMYGGDLAQVIKRVIDRDIKGTFNVAPKDVYTIDEIANIAIQACGKPNLKISYDSSKPDGQYRKDVDASLLNKEVQANMLYTPLYTGIQDTYNLVKGKQPLFRELKK